jgi:phage repressor protein C with HTH and peptisase S24 domain
MIGDRLRELRLEAGLNQPEFAAIANTSKQYVGRLEKGFNKDPNPKYIAAWAKHFKVRIEWIISGKLPKEELVAPPELGDEAWADVTGYSQAAGLGTGPEAAEWAKTHKLKFRRESLARKRLNPRNLAVLYGAGDSMEPTIRAGDAILFDTTDTDPKNRGIYVLLVPGAGAEEYAVKRAVMSKGSMTFVADNLDGDHDWKEPRPLADGMKVVGRVRWTGGWVK